MLFFTTAIIAHENRGGNVLEKKNLEDFSFLSDNLTLDNKEKIMTDLIQMGKQAKAAGRKLATLSTAEKNAALLAIADRLDECAGYVMEQNALDVAAAQENGLAQSFIDRLTLSPKAMANLSQDVRNVATLPDPVGKAIDSRTLPNGIQLTRRRIPIGVIGVIYESRPNVTIDIASLCLKTGNASILRGGKETLRSNVALLNVIQSALQQCGLPSEAVQYIDNPDRVLVAQFLRLDQYVDMLIPRGGQRLHELCKNESNIPVVTGGVGIVHIFVDESADFASALDIIQNSKIQKPSACNALDTLLVHQNIAGAFIPQVVERMASVDVAMRLDKTALSMVNGAVRNADIQPTDDESWDTEWLGYTMGIKVVSGLDEAIDHIETHSMAHTDAILTNNWHNATRFMNEVNSCAVMVNADTRFNDGGQFGLGAEVAVSTQKLHARGPMGLEELTTYKWIAVGDGHVRL